VTLQVEQRLATDVTDLGELEVPERVVARDEAGDVVEGARNVDRDAFVPVGAVDRAPVGGAWGWSSWRAR